MTDDSFDKLSVISYDSSIFPGEFYFDPIDGTFVQIDFGTGNLDQDGYGTECDGTLSPQGIRDTWALMVVLALLSIFLLFLLYFTRFSQ